jgi:hypothetical protein
MKPALLWPLVGMVGPGHLQGVAALARRPPGVGHHDHPAQQAFQRGPAVDDEGVAHALDRLGRGQIDLGHLGGEDRGLEEGRVQHARQTHVDAEQRLAGDDGGGVGLGLGLADDAVGLGVLQRQGLGIGRGQAGGGLGQFAIRGAALAGLVDHEAGFGRQAGGRDVPALGGGLDQQGPPHGPDLAHRLPVVGRRGAAAGRLLAEHLGVDGRLLDADGRPVDVQFLGDQHRHRGLDPLPDLRPLGGDGHHAVGRDADEGVERVRRHLALPPGPGPAG